MTRRLLGVALLGAAVLGTVGEAQGFGRKKKNDCDTPCGPVAVAGCGTSCGYTVSYVDQKVTAYRTEWEKKDVEVWTHEWVSTPEPYKYWVCEPKVTKQKVICKELQTRDEPYKYWTHEWVNTPTVVKVPECRPVTRDVETVVYDLKPVVTKQKRTVCEWVCVPVVVPCAHPAPSAPAARGGLFSRLCGKKSECPPPCPDPCEPCTQVVMHRQPVHHEVDVDVTTYTREPRKVVHQVTTHETHYVDQTVNVKKCVPVQRDGVRKVCYYIDVPRDIDVTTWERKEKDGVREVRKCIPIKRVVPQMVPKCVPYETVIKVPVCIPIPAPCPAPCPTPCGPVMTGGFGGCCN